MKGTLQFVKLFFPSLQYTGKGRRAVHIKKKLAIKLEATVFLLGPRRKFLA